jgi:hypothetical protein
MAIFRCTGVVLQASIVHCKAGFFLLLLLPLAIVGFVGCMWLFLILFGLLVLAALSVLLGAGVFCVLIDHYITVSSGVLKYNNMYT